MTAPLMLPPFQSIEFGPIQIRGANLWKSQMLGPHVSRICHTDVMSHLAAESQTTYPFSWPWLIPFSGPETSSGGAVKATRFKSTFMSIFIFN